MFRIYLITMLALLCASTEAGATVTAYTNKPQWLGVVGSHEFIGFTGFPEFTTITTQYQAQGIIFTDGNDFVSVSGAYQSDGYGLVSSDISFPSTVHMSFDRPRTAIAFDYNGKIQLELYDDGALVFASILYWDDVSHFVGFVSTVPFDSAIASDPVDTVLTIDNVYFGAAVPAPGTFLGLLLGCVFVGRARRRSAR